MKLRPYLPSIVLFLVFLNHNQLKAQLFGLSNQERITINSGLSHNSIMDIHQDKYGFLWVSTADGLNRYDGNEFQIFLPDLEDSTAISDSFIPSIQSDDTGNFWVATQKGGLSYYDYEKEAFVIINNTAFSENQTNFFVTNAESIFFENDSYIWVGTSLGIAKISRLQKESKVEFLLQDRAINCFLRDRNERIWVGTSRGLIKLSANTNEFLPIPSLGFEESGIINALYEDKYGNIFVGAKNGFFLKKAQSEWEEILTFKNGRYTSFQNVNAIVSDHQGRIWIGGQQGLSIIDHQTYKESADVSILNENNLGKENIHALFLDKEENLWIGTANNGLIRLFLSKKRFPVFRQSAQSYDGGTPENTIRSIWAETEDKIWLGSYGAGLFLFDKQSMTFNNYRADPQQSFSLSGNQVSYIYRDRQNTLWVGTWGDGLNEAYQHNGQILFKRKSLSNNPDVDRSNLSDIHQIFEDEFNNLWVVTNGGISSKKYDSKEFEEANHYFDLPEYTVNSLIEDKDGNWWMGTWDGLHVFQKNQVLAAKNRLQAENTKPLASFYYDKDNPNGLSNNRITCLHQDNRGRVWVGTYGGGLNLWQSFDRASTPFQGDFESFSQKEGLPNNVIYGIQEDEQNRLWLSTNNGLVLFDPDENIIQIFTQEDGIQSNQFYFGAYGKTPEGNLIFGGNNGFNVFNPLLYSSKTELPPKVSLSKLLVKGENIPIDSEKAILRRSIFFSDTIFLNPNDNYFQLEFTSPTLNNAQKLKYAYRLKGFNDDWQYTDAQNRYAIYSNLYEGNYTFEVRSSLDGKYWNDSRTLEIRISPPWHRTWWANLLFGLGIILLMITISRLSYVYSTLRNKLELERLQLQKEKEVNELRMWFFTYISHEFRTPLTLILSPISELLKDTKTSINVRQKLQITYRNSKRLLRLVDQILNFRMINSGKAQIKVASGNIVSFAEKIFQSFSEHAKDQSVSYSFKASDEEIELYFDPEKMELILFNLLSNAFKFSGERAQIQLRIQEKADAIILELEDNGLGISQKKLEHIFEPFQRGDNPQIKGSGIGLALVKDLVELHKAELKVSSRKGKGSLFVIIFKKGNDHFEVEEIASANLIFEYDNLDYIEVSDTSKIQAIFPQIARQNLPKLLLVEDESEIRVYFSQKLENQFQVFQAPNGKIGYEMALKHQPDIIISDVMMPIWDGISMVKKLKQEGKTSHIPIILLTAKVAQQHQVEGFEQGAIEYITKPVNIGILKAKVFAILNNIEQLKAHYKHEGILSLDQQKNTNDEKFLLNAAQIVEENFSNPNFNAQQFAKQMGLSRSGLYKKLQALTSKSTTQFIRFIRLKHAERILREGQYNISQTAFQTGFNDLKYFRKCFKEEFGLTPSQFKESA